MSGSDLKQRLAAILAADVVGYSRLMTIDDRSTVAALDAARAVFRSRIEANHGRVIDMAGDSVLAVFETATGAVSAALAIQGELAHANRGVPEERCMRHRIGVHLGDIIEKADGTIYGDGVNIAARLEGLAESGGITVSDSVHGAVRGKIAASFDDQGEQQVKNISYPVRTFAVRASTALPKQSISTVSAANSALVSKPARLSIVVLPFTNASGDPEQDYFSDGITDEVTTQLSRIKGSYIIARDTAFTYKSKDVDVKSLAIELGVRYVLRGSVDRLDVGVDTNVQLIDGMTGVILWADSIEVDRIGIRNIRREVVTRLAIALNLQLSAAEAKRSQIENRDNPDATDLVMQGWAAFGNGHLLTNLDAAQVLFDRALAVQADYQPALVGRSSVMFSRAFAFPSANRGELIEKADADATMAIALDSLDPLAHYALSRVRLIQRRIEAALAECENALALDGNLVKAHAWRGFLLICNGQPELTLAAIDQAITQSPRDPWRSYWFFWKGWAYYQQDKYADAIVWMEKSSYWGASVLLAATYFQTGDRAKASMVIKQLLDFQPNLNASFLRNYLFTDNAQFVRCLERAIGCLIEMGIPNS